MARYSIFAVLACAALVAAMPRQAEAAITDIWFSGKLNQSSDNSAELLLNNPLTAQGPTVGTLNVGDILVTIASLDTNENLTDGGAPINYVAATGSEASALSVIKVATVAPGTGAGRSDFTFTFLSAADIAVLTAAMPGVGAEVATWTSGTMVALYDDATPDFTRGFVAPFPPDDGVPPDTGVGPFLAEDATATTAYDGTRILELGFAGLPTEFWVADESGSDISLFLTLPAGQSGGSFNFGLNALVNNTSFTFANVGNFNPLTGVIGSSQFAGQGGLLGIGGGVATPFDAFDNVDVVFQPIGAIPEPSTLSLFALGFGGLLVYRRQMRRGHVAA